MNALKLGTGGLIPAPDAAEVRLAFDLAPDAIKEYRLQARPYQRVEIRGIVVKPDGVR